MDHQPPAMVTTSLFPEVARPGNRQDDEDVPIGYFQNISTTGSEEELETVIYVRDIKVMTKWKNKNLIGLLFLLYSLVLFQV